MKDPLKSIEWLAFPKDIKAKVVSAYEEHHKAIFSSDDIKFYEADRKTYIADKQIHKALGINLDYLPEKTSLAAFISELKASMKTGYNIFEVEVTDPLMNKINDHMDKFRTIKAAAMKQAQSNVEQKQVIYRNGQGEIKQSLT